MKAPALTMPSPPGAPRLQHAHVLPRAQESYAALLHHGRRVNFVRSLLYFSQSILSLVQLGCDSASALVAVASPSGGPVFCASLRPVDRVAPHAILAALASLVQVGLALHEQILVRRHARSFSIPGVRTPSHPMYLPTSSTLSHQVHPLSPPAALALDHTPG